MIANESNIEDLLISAAITKDLSLVSGLEEKHFFKPQNRKLFLAAKESTSSDGPQSICLQAGLQEKETEYYISLADSWTQDNQEIRKIFSLLISKRIEREYLSMAASGEAENPLSVVHEAEELIAKLKMDYSVADAETCIDDYQEYLEKAIDRSGEEFIGITTGIEDLDRKIMGIKDHDYILVAARPSMGKTSLVTMFFAEGIRAEGVPVMFSLEMPKEQIMGRIMAQQSQGLTLAQTIYGKNMDDKSRRLIERMSAALKKRSFYIEDFTEHQGSLGVTVDMLDARLSAIEQSQGSINMIIVDYIQLLTGSSPRQSQNERTSYISSSLKALGRKYGCPVIALSQLNRDLERRADKRPQMSDLRDSGALEQDADIIMFVYRPDVYLERELLEQIKNGKEGAQRELELLHSRDSSVAEIIVGKQRNGPTGSVIAVFEKSNARFFNMDTDLEDFVAKEYGRPDGMYEKN